MPPRAKAKTVEDTYRKHDLRDHIYELPDTFAGSPDPHTVEVHLYDEATKRMVKRAITYVPALYKCFDEVLVNALDQVTRLKGESAAGKEDVRPVKNIRVTLDRATGRIEVLNDGDGIDVEKHAEYNMYVPELVFGNLLTSANYDKEEERTVGGKNGVGAKVANIFAKEFIVETLDHRRHKLYKQRFFDNMKGREDPKVVASQKKVSFTRIEWLPDYARFGMQGMTDDLYALLQRRTLDAGACTDSDVAVYFNGIKLEFKDFEHYVDLFIGTRGEHPRVYETMECDGRPWEVVATYSTIAQFEQISFVNGIHTLRGGKHVDNMVGQITRRLSEMVATKKKKEVKAQHLKDNLMVFIKSTVVNPSFDSQSKESLMTLASKFGVKAKDIELSDKFMDKLYKTGIVESALRLTEFHEDKQLAKTDGKKLSRVIVPKLDDAIWAGTKRSEECTLILTEGDSAKTMAVAGLSVVGRERYGVFPLKGKILNVRNAAPSAIANNDELSALKKILGLEQGKVYHDISTLRYGRIMVMTDADVDGSHIRGLLFNVFHAMWPSLCARPGFLTAMITPVVKATHNSTKQITSFYSLPQFGEWHAAHPTGWSLKYYKGLGTSTPEEAKEYFRSLRITAYEHTGAPSNDAITLAFHKDRADDRKAMLRAYNPKVTLDYERPKISFEEFVHKDLVHFSNSDCERSIPHLADGLKVSLRKILYGCLKRKLWTKEIRVAQLSGYISEVSLYHHGEKSLQDAIVGMAQVFAGTDNINLLEPIGQFGTRIHGGKDAASARYIHTLLTPLARACFREEDTPVLDVLEDDGEPVEPVHYVPVVPLVLINGAMGIGTGFNTSIQNHNPEDVVANCRALLAALDGAGLSDAELDGAAAHAAIDAVALAPMHPWYLGWTGTITPVTNDRGEVTNYQAQGKWAWKDESTLEITELPVRVWTEKYKTELYDMMTNAEPKVAPVKDIEIHYTDKTIRFLVKFGPGARKAIGDNVATLFGLTTKNMAMGNMHLYGLAGAIEQYESTASILRTWARLRLATYVKRKAHQLAEMERRYVILSAKVRFIDEIVAGKLLVMNRKRADLEADLAKRGYPTEAAAGAETVETADGEFESSGKYGYLTRLPIQQLTYERKLALEKEAAALAAVMEALRAKSVRAIWAEELTAFEAAWKEHRARVEADIQASAKASGVTGAAAGVAKPRATKAAAKK